MVSEGSEYEKFKIDLKYVEIINSFSDSLQKGSLAPKNIFYCLEGHIPCRNKFRKCWFLPKNAKNGPFLGKSSP